MSIELVARLRALKLHGMASAWPVVPEQPALYFACFGSPPV